MSGGSSEPPLERAFTLRGPTALQRPNSETVWYARLEHCRMSSDAPVDICSEHTHPSQHTLMTLQQHPAVGTVIYPSLIDCRLPMHEGSGVMQTIASRLAFGSRLGNTVLDEPTFHNACSGETCALSHSVPKFSVIPRGSGINKGVMQQGQGLTWPHVSSSAARPPMSMAIWPRSSESNSSALSSAFGGMYVNLQRITGIHLSERLQR